MRKKIMEMESEHTQIQAIQNPLASFLPYVVQFDDGTVNSYGDEDLEFVTLPTRWQAPEFFDAATAKQKAEEVYSSARSQVIDDISPKLQAIVAACEKEKKDMQAKKKVTVTSYATRLRNLGIPSGVVTHFAAQHPGLCQTVADFVKQGILEEDVFSFIEKHDWLVSSSRFKDRRVGRIIHLLPY